MNILFVHQNFPGQFKFLAPELAKHGHNVHALTLRTDISSLFPTVKVSSYSLSRSSSTTIHPWLSDLESKVIRGDACFRAALKLKNQGFTPDTIIAHPGWGESLFLKEVWPDAKLGLYCEFFYNTSGFDINFDPEFPASSHDNSCRLILKNANNMLQFPSMDAGLSPTHWQASTYPSDIRQNISVIHDGIDVTKVIPNNSVKITLNNNLTLSRQDEVITFVNRNLEPYRGYHIFMRALPELLKTRPKMHVLIVGDKGVSYGAAPPSGMTWKSIFISEVRHLISDADWDRVHFMGSVPYHHFLAILQLSRAHIYLSYPFVLSWSLLEAMSAKCAIIASNTLPVKEVITHQNSGLLVDFFDINQLIEQINMLLDDQLLRKYLGDNARKYCINNFSLHDICVPRQLDWVNSLSSS